MKLFTFSGISASLAGVNAGLGIIELANQVVAAMPPDETPSYTGVNDVDHFRSFVNFGTMLGEIQDAVQFAGSTVLNEEANRLSPAYATAMSAAMASDPEEDVLVLAHSQGTNNLTWTLLHLAQTEPEFFQSRSVRCALFDPKVGRNFMEEIFGRFTEDQLSFLFFQSENDVLGDQGMLIPKFITEFQYGNHLWVKGLDHGTIRDWAALNKPQRWLDWSGYRDFRREWGLEVISLKQEMRGNQMGTVQLLKLDKWENQYAKDEMGLDKLSEALLGFLQGELPKKYISKH